MQKGQAQVLILAGIVILIALVGGIFYLGRVTLPRQDSSGQAAPKPQPQNVATSSPQPSPTPDETANWEIYGGKYFSFKYPAIWSAAVSTTGQSEIGGYSKVLEITNSRISPNAVFQVTYRDISYEERLKEFSDRKAQKLTLDGREATRFQVDGEGHPLPQGYSIITIIVKGSDNTSYAITFNGDRKDITDLLINQILSTFRFD